MIAKGVRRARRAATPRSPRRPCAFDRRINRMECEVDELACASSRPASPSPPTCASSPPRSKIVTDLERIGDLCVNICERVIELNEEPPLKPYLDCRAGRDGAGVVHDALDALRRRRRGARAAGSSSATTTSTSYYAHIFRDVLDLMARTRATSTEPPACSRSPSTSSASPTTRRTSRRWSSSWCAAKTSATAEARAPSAGRRRRWRWATLPPGSPRVPCP